MRAESYVLLAALIVGVPVLVRSTVQTFRELREADDGQEPTRVWTWEEQAGGVEVLLFGELDPPVVCERDKAGRFVNWRLATDEEVDVSRGKEGGE